MIRRPPRSTRVRSSAASDVYKRQISRTTENTRRLSSVYSDLAPFQSQMMINSAILLLLILLSFEHAKKSRLENTHQKTHNARKRKERNIPTKESTNTKYKISLSLSLHFVPPSLLVCLAFYPKIWTRMDAWQPKNEKFRSSFPHSAFSSAASPDT